jgi:hypothetical protein
MEREYREMSILKMGLGIQPWKVKDGIPDSKL